MTLDRIKKQAKRIKKALGVKHSEALNLAAISAGFPSYRHAVVAAGPKTKKGKTS